MNELLPMGNLSFDLEVEFFGSEEFMKTPIDHFGEEIHNRNRYQISTEEMKESGSLDYSRMTYM